MVFWGTSLLFYCLSDPLIRVIRPLLGLVLPSAFLTLLEAIVLILSFLQPPVQPSIA